MKIKNIAILFIFLANALFAEAADTLKSYRTEEIVITGTRKSTRISEVPLSVTSVPNYLLENSLKTNILNKVASVTPGAFIDSRTLLGFGISNPSSGTISMRGISSKPNTRILFLIDGQPQFMGIFSHPFNDMYSNLGVEKVEVLRGPSSILYGSNSMAGAVNIITREKFPEGFHAILKAAYGSGKSREFASLFRYQLGDISFSLGGQYSGTEGHRKDANDRFNSLGLNFKSGYVISDNYSISAMAHLTDSKFYDPGKVTSPKQNDYYNYRRNRVGLTLDNKYGALNGAFKISYNWGLHDFFDGYKSFDNNAGVTAYECLRLHDKFNLTLGMDNQLYGGKAENAIVGKNKIPGFDKNHKLWQNDLYALFELGLFEKMNLSAGLRNVNNSKFGSDVVPFAGFSVPFPLDSSLIIKGNYSAAIVNPSIVDLYFFKTANSELKPEKAENYEISFLKRFFEQSLITELTLFYIEGHDMINEVKTANSVIPRKINSGNFINRGVEASLQAAITNTFSLGGNYSYVKTNKERLYAPVSILNLLADYQYGIYDFQLELRSIKSLLTDASSGKKISYELLNANVSVSLMNNLSLSVRAENLLNKYYYHDLGYPAPGRSYFCACKLEI